MHSNIWSELAPPYLARIKYVVQNVYGDLFYVTKILESWLADINYITLLNLKIVKSHAKELLE